MKFKRVSQREIGWALVEGRAVVRDARFGNKISIAGNEGCLRIGSSGAACTSGIGHHGRHSAKAVCWVAAAGGNGADWQVEAKCIVVFGNISVTSSEGKVPTHALFQRKNSGIVRARLPGTKTILEVDRGIICDSRLECQVRLAGSENIPNIFVIEVR